MAEDRRSILQRVASGELSPEAAAELLDQLGRGAPTPPPPPAPEPGGTPPFEPLRDDAAAQADRARSSTATATIASPLRKVRIVRNLGAARVVGDPEVREAVAEGPHRAERLRDELVIHSDFDEEGGFNFASVQGQWGRYRNARLNVRMRPDLPLEVQAQGGSVQVQGVTGPISGEVQASTVNVEGGAGPLDLRVQAGSLTWSGVLTHGRSTLRCEAGSIRLVLRPGSNVRIVARATMGHLSLPGQALGESDDVVMGAGSREVTLGTGEAELEIESTMGSVRITQE